MKQSKKKRKEESIWRRELIPRDSVWGKELVSENSIWGRDLLAFAKRKSQCLECPILMLAEERKCNKFDRIPEDIWDGLELCPLYYHKTG